MPDTPILPQFPDSISALFKHFRTEMKMSQEQIAKELGISQNTVSLIERAIIEPDRRTTTDWHTSDSPLANWIANEIFIVRARQALNINRRPDM